MEQICYYDPQISKEKQGLYLLKGGKFGADELIYEDDPQKCHSKYTLNYKCDNLVAINRLAEKTDKIPLIQDPPIKIIRKYRRLTRKEKKQQKQ